MADERMSETDTELREIVKCCLAGNTDARVRFQGLLGDFIYNYPVKMFHLPNDRAGDFYIYVFENDRLFKRLKGFEGRNNAQFRTYLGYYVLRDLFLEWQRGQKEPETVSFETIVARDHLAGEETTLNDFIADPGDGPEDLVGSKDQTIELKKIFAGLALDKRVMLKLLHLAELDLIPKEVRFICQKSGRRHSEVVSLVEQMRARLRKKDEQFSALENQLDSVFGWILIYQKEFAQITDQLNSAPDGSPKHAELRRRKDELERKLNWRCRQRGQLLEKSRQFRVTTPYKDIATLLNVPLGTVCSLVARTRAEAIKTLDDPTVLRQAAAI